jgi:hypothetical protein
VDRSHDSPSNGDRASACLVRTFRAADDLTAALRPVGGRLLSIALRGARRDTEVVVTWVSRSGEQDEIAQRIWPEFDDPDVMPVEEFATAAVVHVIEHLDTGG